MTAARRGYLTLQSSCGTDCAEVCAALVASREARAGVAGDGMRPHEGDACVRVRERAGPWRRRGFSPPTTCLARSLAPIYASSFPRRGKSKNRKTPQPQSSAAPTADTAGLTTGYRKICYDTDTGAKYDKALGLEQNDFGHNRFSKGATQEFTGTPCDRTMRCGARHNTILVCFALLRYQQPLGYRR